MRFQIPNITKFYGGVSDTNTNSTKYILETPNNPKYKYFWLFGTPNCHALVPAHYTHVPCLCSWYWLDVMGIGANKLEERNAT